jgi:hypothetical protein
VTPVGTVLLELRGKGVPLLPTERTAATSATSATTASATTASASASAARRLRRRSFCRFRGGFCRFRGGFCRFRGGFLCLFLFLGAVLQIRFADVLQAFPERCDCRPAVTLRHSFDPHRATYRPPKG